MINDVKAPLAIGPVHTANIDQDREGADRVIAQETQHVSDVCARTFNRQFIHRHGSIAQLAAKALRNALLQCIQIHTPASTINRAGAPDFALKQHHTIDECFRRRRATGHIDVDRNNAIAPTHNRIRIVIIAAAIRA